MDCEKIELKSKTIVGIKVVTSNQPGHADKDIPSLWQRFFAEGIREKIQDKVDGKIYGIYTEYEGDHTKPYSVVIGCEVSNAPTTLAEGFVSYKTAPSTYAKVPLTGSDFKAGLMDAWKKVWMSDLERSFTTDFESYDENFDPEKGCEGASLYIAVK